VIALARRQHGIVSREQVLTLGVRRRTLECRTAQGLLTSRGRRLLVLPGTPDDLATRSRLLGWSYPESVLTAHSAALLTGSGPWQDIDLGDEPSAIHPRRRFPARFVAHPGVRSFQIDGLQVALPRHTVVDLIRFLPLNDARRVAYRAVQKSVISVDWLVQTAQVLSGLGGVGQLRDVVADLRTGAHSHLETRLVRLLQRAGMRGWVANFRVRLGDAFVVVDVAFPDVRVAVEVDGRAHHTDQIRFQRDRTRQNALVSAGWVPLRFTWEDITQRPQRVLNEIRSAVQQ
jgi:very-short-patch-repair endonuclease